MKNTRLTKLMDALPISVDQLASKVQVDPKTVRKWQGGVVPHPSHQVTTSKVLNADREYLWPKPKVEPKIEPVSAKDEIIDVWSHRTDAPNSIWRSLIEGAHQHIDLLGYAIQHIPESVTGLTNILESKAVNRCQIRILVADPNSHVVLERAHEEGLGGDRSNNPLSSRILTTLKHLNPIFGVPGIEVKLHESKMYTSIFRGDDSMLVSTHLYGIPGHAAPLYKLNRVQADGLFDKYQSSFEKIWNSSNPLREA